MRVKSKGFTLIEIMVVVVIAAIMMGAVTLSFPNSTGEDILKKEADRFEALMHFAQDEATLQSREFALALDQTGYTFYFNDDGNWSEAQDSFSRNDLPDVVLPSLILEEQTIALGKKNKVKPQILILSTGEVTPFRYKLSYLNEVSKLIDVDAGGLISQTTDDSNAK